MTSRDRGRFHPNEIKNLLREKLISFIINFITTIKIRPYGDVD
jgi:hypothetical protein